MLSVEATERSRVLAIGAHPCARRISSAGDDPERVDHAGHPHKNAEQDVDREVLADAFLQADCERWQEQRDDDEYELVVYVNPPW